MKLRSAKHTSEQQQGSKRRAQCGGREHVPEEGKSKRRRSSEVEGGVDVEGSKHGECVCGAGKARENGKGGGNGGGKRKRSDVGGGEGRNGKKREKGEDGSDGAGGGDVRGVGQDVILRSRCTLRTLCALHARMTPYQRDAVKETVLRPVLEYGEMDMERHLTLALIQSWDRRRKAFRIAGRQVRFTVYDVILFTGLPGIGQRVDLDGEEVSTMVGGDGEGLDGGMGMAGDGEKGSWEMWEETTLL